MIVSEHSLTRTISRREQAQMAFGVCRFYEEKLDLLASMGTAPAASQATGSPAVQASVRTLEGLKNVIGHHLKVGRIYILISAHPSLLHQAITQVWSCASPPSPTYQGIITQ